MPNAIEMTGYKIGHITVIRREGSKNGQSTWLCKCSCGKTFVQYGGALRNGKVISCGHIYADKTERQKIAHNSIAKTKHGDCSSRLYFVWLDMRRRCDSPNDISYKNYGARGIKVCDEWSSDYVAFKEWAINAGYNPNAKRGECTLDRIDPNGDYSPDNCRWVSMNVQSNNRRNSYTITWNGETHTSKEWESITGIPRGTIYTRYKSGWPIDKIFSKIKYKHKKNTKAHY